MTALRLTRIIHSMMLKRALTFESLNDCLTSLQQIEDAEREELLIEAHGIFQANLFDDLLQGLFDYRLKTQRIRVAPSTQLQVKFNDVSILTCYHGSFENDCIKRGHMIVRRKIAYIGEFLDWKPHGQGVSYHDNGEKHTEGEFKHGHPDGVVKRYRTDGSLQFDGFMVMDRLRTGSLFRKDGSVFFIGGFDDCIPSRGTWYNTKDIEVCTGRLVEFNQIMTERLPTLCSFEMTGTIHVPQQWFTCITCFGDSPSKGVCLACSKTCHQGHDLVDRGVSGFYCDCGAGEVGCVKCVAN